LKAFRNEFIWRLTERSAINSAEAVLFTCKEELELARNTFKGYSARQELNVGLGIMQPPTFNVSFQDAFKKCCPELKGADYFLFLSRIDRKKGVAILIDAYQSLQAEGVSLPHLVIAGPLDNSYAKEMQEKAKGNATIHFPGMLKGAAKWGAFYGSTLFLLPSHQENFGIAIIEAMACAVPVLITKQVNIWQEISSGGAGMVLEKPTIETLQTELLAFLSLNQENKDKYKAQAKATFEKSFFVSHTALTFIEVLKKLPK
jgi:glycosyltransferase involved in cell wall biosynthesis